MAKKITEEVVTTEEPEELQEEAPAEEKPAKKAKAAEPKSEWDEKVEMIVPRKPKGEDQQYYVCVNDVRYAVPANGKMQKLPRPVAEILQDAIEADYKADEFADNIPNRDPVSDMQKQMEKLQAMMDQMQQMQQGYNS